MVRQKKGGQLSGAPAQADILNFHFATSPPPRNPPPQRRPNHRSRQSDQDRSSARRKPSPSMFHLHSSANHAFSLTRKSKQGYSFHGPDVAVSWEAVRVVKYLAPSTDASGEVHESCPVCLDTFTCPRITKCGHCFCLSCLLRHVHTSTTANVYQPVKCPCCGLPMHIEDIRPVLVESVQPPKVSTRMKLVKLHRTKECPSPYLPQRGHWKRSSPHTAPNMTDDDAIFSRFTYIDPFTYHRLLTSNRVELEKYLCQLQKCTPNDLEVVFVQMSLDRINHDIKTAVGELDEEQVLMERYAQISAGLYQHIPEHLFASNYSVDVKKSGSFDETNGSQVEDSDLLSAAGHNDRGETLGSDHQHRIRGESVGSEGETVRIGRPTRGHSLDSADPCYPPDQKQHYRELRLPPLPASLYLEDHTCQFYQSPDGQLCFLSKFNMNCLTADFSTSLPQESLEIETMTENDARRRQPLPDVIEGHILEVETIHLTPEMRKRMPFLSHLPLYTDILFVELDLNRILSYETKRQFKNEFEKRKQRRKNKVVAEKRVDRQRQRKEQERINELKARIQRIDPTDDFFQHFVPDPEMSMTGDEFGPAIGGGAQQSPMAHSQNAPVLNFSAVVLTPSAVTVTEDSFPSLGVDSFPGLGPASIPPSSQPSWGRGWHAVNTEPRAAAKAEELSMSPPQVAGLGKKGKRSKNKEKVLLFSTGGQRGGY